MLFVADVAGTMIDRVAFSVNTYLTSNRCNVVFQRKIAPCSISDEIKVYLIHLNGSSYAMCLLVLLYLLF